MIESLSKETIPFAIVDFYSSLAAEIGTGRMLDLGCGRGNAMRPFCNAGWDVVGVDVDPESLKYAAKYGQVILRNGEEPLVDLEDESFDVISANAVFHHMKDIDGNLSELIRCVKPGGLILINEVVEDSPWMRLGRNVFSSWKGMRIYSRLYVRDWVEVFERHNLSLVRTYGQSQWASLALVSLSFLSERLRSWLKNRLTRKAINVFSPDHKPIMFILFILKKA